MLQVKNLVRRFDSEIGQPPGGVFGLDLDVREGEIFTLLGPSGCGKTTTLRCIAGLEHPEKGTIVLDRRELFNSDTGLLVPMHDRNIGMVFQSYAIWPHMTVTENAAYPLRVSRSLRPNRAEIQSRVRRVLEMVGLEQYGDRSATKLSGGQQQRLALARALVREPKLLLLDEPLSNLDALLREQMRSELKRLQLEWGVTTIYVTHDQNEAMAISDRIAVLKQGQIVQIGTPAGIYDLPGSEFVANFVGRSNLFQGRLKGEAKAGAFGIIQSDMGPLTCFFREAQQDGTTLLFVIRPENVELGPVSSATAEGDNRLEGRIVREVYLGEITEYTVELPNRAQLLVRGRPVASFLVGNQVVVRLPAHHVVAIA